MRSEVCISICKLSANSSTCSSYHFRSKLCNTERCMLKVNNSMKMFANFNTIKINVTSQYELQDESLTGQIPTHEGQCPMTGCYFQPCLWFGHSRSSTLTEAEMQCSSFKTIKFSLLAFWHPFFPKVELLNLGYVFNMQVTVNLNNGV